MFASLRCDVGLQHLIRPAVSSVVERKCTTPCPHSMLKRELHYEDARIRLKAACDWDDASTARFKRGGLDSVAVSVVTAEGSVYEFLGC